MNMKHPYIKYAQALLIEENNLESIEDITHNHIKQELAKGLDTFSLKPIKDFVGKEKVKYSFVSEKNDAKHFIYLSPNIISKGHKTKCNKMEDDRKRLYMLIFNQLGRN